MTNPEALISNLLESLDFVINLFFCNFQVSRTNLKAVS